MSLNWVNITILVGIIIGFYFVYLYLYGRKTTRYFLLFFRQEFFWEKYEKDYWINRNTTSAIKRGLFELIYIQQNLINPPTKSFLPARNNLGSFTYRDVANSLDTEKLKLNYAAASIDFRFEHQAMMIVANHNKIKSENIPQIKSRYVDGEFRNICHEEMNFKYEKRALQWFEDAAGIGLSSQTKYKPDLLGFVLAGFCYLQGVGTKRNHKKAKEYFDKANFNIEETGYKLNLDK